MKHVRKGLLGLIILLTIVICIADAAPKLYVGDKRTEIYHDADCPTGRAIPMSEVEMYGTPEEAEKEGFKPCGDCL